MRTMPGLNPAKPGTLLVLALAFVIALPQIGSALDSTRALYVSGRFGADLRAQFPRAYKATEGRIDTSSSIALRFETDGRGSLTIPYASITSLVYSGLIESVESTRELTRYPWSGAFRNEYGYRANKWSNKCRPCRLTIFFREEAGTKSFVVFALGDAIAGATLRALEARTGLRIDVRAAEGCVQFRSGDECAYGTPAELKGLDKVFVDTGDSREWTDGESSRRIRAAIEESGVAVRFVARLEEANIVLVFLYDAGTKPQWLGGTYSIPDRALGEVYIARSEGLRLVMAFEETWGGMWRTKLASRFGNAFVEAYRRANGRE